MIALDGNKDKKNYLIIDTNCNGNSFGYSELSVSWLFVVVLIICGWHIRKNKPFHFAYPKTE